MADSEQYKPLPVWAWVTFTYLLIAGLLQTIGVLFSIYTVQLRHPAHVIGLAFVIYIYRKVQGPK